MFDMLQFFSQFFLTLQPAEQPEFDFNFWKQFHKQLPYHYNFSPEYLIPGSYKVINTISKVILKICPDVHLLFPLW